MGRKLMWLSTLQMELYERLSTLEPRWQWPIETPLKRHMESNYNVCKLISQVFVSIASKFLDWRLSGPLKTRVFMSFIWPTNLLWRSFSQQVPGPSHHRPLWEFNLHSWGILLALLQRHLYLSERHSFIEIALWEQQASCHLSWERLKKPKLSL